MTANVALTDTFDQWRVKTNEVLVMTQTDGMNNIVKTTDTTNSTSNTTGSIITAGGVGIAKSVVIGENLKVHGNTVIDGDTTISGNLVFGSADTDQVSFSADINSNMIPNANVTYNLGNTTMYWANTWTGHLTTEQKSDSGKPALTVSSLDVDQIAIDVNASQTTGNVLDITADAATTASVINVSADALTTGSAVAVDSDSADTGTRNIVSITQNHASATGTTALAVQADAGKGIFIDSNLAAGGPALEIDSEHTTANAIEINVDPTTSATAINLSADGLTTGSIMALTSDSSDTGTRTLVSIKNDNASATAAVPLVVTQDSTNAVAKFTGTSTIVIPVGTTSNRGHAIQGGIRYNSQISSFEGYSGSSWGSLGGLIDVDQDTKIIAETSAGADNDDLDFYTAGTQRMKIDETGKVTVGVDDTGYDVVFYGATAGAYLEWDESADELELRGGAATPGKLLLSTAETTVVDGNKIGQIDFQAPLDSAGTDAILVGASIWAEANDTFSATVNNMELVFATGLSETATEKMRITSDGKVGIGISSSITDALHVKTTAVETRISLESSTGKWAIGAEDGDKFGILNYGTSTPFVIDSAGKIGIGTSTPGELLNLALAGEPKVLLNGYSTSAGESPAIVFERSNHGTLGTNTAVDDGDYLGTILFRGATGSAYNTGAEIRGIATDTFSGSAAGSALEFYTVDDDTTQKDLRMLIDQSGHIGIGNSTPEVRLDTICNTNEVVASFARSTDASTYVSIRTAETQNHVGGWYHNVGTSARTAVNSTNSVTGILSKVMNSGGTLKGEMQFHTNIGDSLTQKMTITENGQVLIGHSASVSMVGYSSALQIQGTTGDTSTMSITRNSNDADPAILTINKTRGTSTGASTVVADGDVVGVISFGAGDGTDVTSAVAAIRAKVGGTPGGNDTPGLFQFQTTPDGADAPTTKWQIAQNGHFEPGTNNSYNVGHSSAKCANIYTTNLYLGDAIFDNTDQAEGNIVDGTQGKWRVQEGADHLYVINELTGKKYKMGLEEA